MIRSEPGPGSFVLKQVAELSVREMRRRADPLWAWQLVQYHDGKDATNAELIELMRVKYSARSDLFAGRDPARQKQAEARLRHYTLRQEQIRSALLGQVNTISEVLGLPGLGIESCNGSGVLPARKSS